jgi:protein-disulfide isomerase
MNRRALLLAGVAAISGVGGLFLARDRNSPLSLPDLGAAHAETPAEPASVVEMVLGSNDAPITVVEYASFTCPHCANFHATVMPSLKAEYIETGKVKFIYRDVYFDRFGLWASMVARCEPTRFFGVSDMLYSQQKDWIAGGDPALIADNLRKIGKVAGLTEEQLNTCLTDGAKAEALVAWWEANSTADEINSTPSLIIDGEKHSNMSFADLKAILDKKLGL